MYKSNSGLPVRMLYITDPMCTWCYAFTQVIRRLRAVWRDKLFIQPVYGGLNPFATEPLTLQQVEQLAVAWHKVQTRTDLPFDYRFFLHKGFVYNTEPAVRALISIRNIRPVLELEALRIFLSAFHAGNVDITNTDDILSLIKLLGINENLFLAVFESEELIAQTDEEFRFAHLLPFEKYPTLLVENESEYIVLSKGFSDYQTLESRWLDLTAQRI